jgi:hypothetical protein
MTSTIQLPSKAVTKRVLNDELITTPEAVTADSVMALVKALSKREWTLDHILERLEQGHEVGDRIRTEVLKLKLRHIAMEQKQIEQELASTK